MLIIVSGPTLEKMVTSCAFTCHLCELKRTCIYQELSDRWFEGSVVETDDLEMKLRLR